MLDIACMHRLPPSAWLPQFFAHIARLPGTQFMYDFFSIQILFPSIPMNRNILQVYNETPGHTPNPASARFP